MPALDADSAYTTPYVWPLSIRRNWYYDAYYADAHKGILDYAGAWVAGGVNRTAKGIGFGALRYCWIATCSIAATVSITAGVFGSEKLSG